MTNAQYADNPTKCIGPLCMSSGVVSWIPRAKDRPPRNHLLCLSHYEHCVKQEVTGKEEAPAVSEAATQ